MELLTALAPRIRVLAPVLYHSNILYAGYLPISSLAFYDNTGAVYNTTRILNPDASFNLSVYKAYPPLFIPTAFAISHGASLAAIPATLIHAWLYFRRQIRTRARQSLPKPHDIHARLMSKYAEVP